MNVKMTECLHYVFRFRGSLHLLLLLAPSPMSVDHCQQRIIQASSLSVTPVRHSMVETASITSQDNTTLSSFLDSRAAEFAEEAAKTVARVAHAATTGVNVEKQSVQLAKNTLILLCEQPSAAVLPHLIPLCEQVVPMTVIDAFVLCTTAWKVVCATLTKCKDDDAVMVACNTLHIMQCACRCALDMLTPQFTDNQSAAGHVSRCIRVVKFYCAHAKRCAELVAQISKPCIRVDADRINFSDIAATVFRLIAALTQISATQSDSGLPDQIQTEIGGPITKTAADTLAIFLRFLPALLSSSGTCATALINDSLQLVGDATALEKNAASRVFDAQLMRLFTVLHLMRFGASSLDQNGYDWLHQFFKSSLCRNLFESLDGAYDSIVTLRHPSTGIPILHSVYTIAAQSLVATPQYVNLNGLLMEMSARNPARATVSSNILKSLYVDTPHLRKHIIRAVVRCARGAWALRSAHFESRWLPLATLIAEKSFRRPEAPGLEFDLLTALHVSRDQTPVIGPSPRGLSLKDAFSIRIVAALCERIADQGKDVHNEVACLFDKLKLNKQQARDRVDKHIAYLKKHDSGRYGTSGSVWVDAIVRLVPFLYDLGKDACATQCALACDTRGMLTINSTTFCAILNRLDISEADQGTLQQLGRACLHLIKRDGLSEAYVSMIGFAGRVLEPHGGSGQGLDWTVQMMHEVLETATRPADGIGNVDIREEAVRGGAIWRGARAKRAINGLSKDARHALEDTEKARWRGEEREWIAVEKRRGARPAGNGRAVTAAGVNRTDAAREAIVEAVRLCEGHVSEDAGAQFEALQDVLAVARAKLGCVISK